MILKLIAIQIIITTLTIIRANASEDRYLRYVKDNCYLKGEAFSCVKYRALRIAKKTLFGDMNNNETIQASNMISFVPLDEETIKNLTVTEDAELLTNEPRGFLSEWTEIAKYFMSLVTEFFKMKGLRVNLPEGSRTIEDQAVDDGRGKRKKLAVMIPLLNLLATLKTKMLLIPILLAVMLIKKLLLVAALLLPSLLSTLKACKQHHHPMTHYSYLGSDTTDFNSDYANSYSYSSGGGYGKDWPTNRAYTLSKHRPTSAPVYITAPGAVA
ncbi:uncharacterized protein LOC120634368 [Pararge aegeria]|uniref:uncharacterized protein LOC120634368 n=1 Tax=Pararge aegeria TaxID=116150 RepID=UPI0019D1D5F0|nr:uncharacterized protein LOC120634368 [Pararge aegeria]